MATVNAIADRIGVDETDSDVSLVLTSEPDTEERRRDGDYFYTKNEFLRYYGGLSEWNAAGQTRADCEDCCDHEQGPTNTPGNKCEDNAWQHTPIWDIDSSDADADAILSDATDEIEAAADSHGHGLQTGKIDLVCMVAAEGDEVMPDTTSESITAKAQLTTGIAIKSVEISGLTEVNHIAKQELTLIDGGSALSVLPKKYLHNPRPTNAMARTAGGGMHQQTAVGTAKGTIALADGSTIEIEMNDARCITGMGPLLNEDAFLDQNNGTLTKTTKGPRLYTINGRQVPTITVKSNTFINIVWKLAPRVPTIHTSRTRHLLRDGRGRGARGKGAHRRHGRGNSQIPNRSNLKVRANELSRTVAKRSSSTANPMTQQKHAEGGHGQVGEPPAGPAGHRLKGAPQTKPKTKHKQQADSSKFNNRCDYKHAQVKVDSGRTNHDYLVWCVHCNDGDVTTDAIHNIASAPDSEIEHALRKIKPDPENRNEKIRTDTDNKLAHQVLTKTRAKIDLMPVKRLIDVVVNNNVASIEDKLNKPAQLYAQLRLARLGVFCLARGHSELYREHHRLGHCSMIQAAKNVRARGVKLDAVEQAFCDHCAMIKSRAMKMQTILPKEPKSDVNPLLLWHADVWTSRIPSMFGTNRYMLVVVSKMGRIELEFAPRMNQFKTMMRKVLIRIREMTDKLYTSRRTIVLVTDGAGYFKSAVASELYAHFDVQHQLSAPYTPTRNSPAEAAIKRIVQGANTMISAESMPISLWPEASAYKALLLQLTDRPSNPAGESPFKATTGDEPDQSLMHAFGQRIFIWRAIRGVQQPRAHEARYIGYSLQHHAMIVWIRVRGINHKIHSLSGRVDPRTPLHIFNGDHDANIDDGGWDTMSTSISTDGADVPPPMPMVTPRSPNLPIPPTPTKPVQPTDTKHQDTTLNLDETTGWNKSEDIFQGYAPGTEQRDAVPWTAPISNLQDEIPDTLIKQTFPSKPMYSLAQAMRVDPGYKEAMEKELGGLIDLGALKFISCDEVKPDEATTRAMVIYYPVFHANGDLKKLKCRITVNGRSQQKGHHYELRSTSMPRQATKRLIFAIEPLPGGLNCTSTGDVPQAFPTTENWTPSGQRVLMKLPEDITPRDSGGRPMIAIVSQAVYGGPSAGLLFEVRNIRELKKIGATQSKFERNVFYFDVLQSDLDLLTSAELEALTQFVRKTPKGTPTEPILPQDVPKVIAGIHVDDFLIRGLRTTVVRLQKQINTIYGECGWQNDTCVTEYIGMTVEVAQNGWVALSMHGYCSKMIKTYGLDPRITKRTPLPSGIYLTHEDRAGTPTAYTKQVQQTLGEIGYAAQSTLLQLAFMQSMIGQVAAQPKAPVLAMLKHTLEYLKSNSWRKLQYRSTSAPNQMLAYCDASFNTGSYMCWIVYMNDAPIAYRVKYTKAATSSTHAETLAMFDLVKELAFLVGLAEEMGYPQLPVQVRCDSTPLLASLEQDAAVTDGNKHLITKLTYIREAIHELKICYTVKWPTKWMVADIGTKNNTFNTFARLQKGVYHHSEFEKDASKEYPEIKRLLGQVHSPPQRPTEMDNTEVISSQYRATNAEIDVNDM